MTMDDGHAQICRVKWLRSSFPNTLWYAIEDEQASAVVGGNDDPDRPVIVGTIPTLAATAKIKIRLKSYDY